MRLLWVAAVAGFFQFPATDKIVDALQYSHLQSHHVHQPVQALDQSTLVTVTLGFSKGNLRLCATVDKQFFPYHGRTRFTQYIPNKPAIYGINVWWICDYVSNYPLKRIICKGKPPVRD